MREQVFMSIARSIILLRVAWKLRKALHWSFLILIVCPLTACSPSLKQTMPVPDISVSVKSTVSNASSAFVFVDEIKDGRSNPRLAEIKGKESSPDSPIGPKIQETLSDALSKAGFSISDSAPVMIAGEVREWQAQVQGGMASKVESNASLHLEVFDPANKRIFSGTYHGNAARQSPSLDEKGVRENLGIAMSQAIQQVLNDEQLMKLLTSF